MCNSVKDGIHLTKEYAREGFLPMDLQWDVIKVANDFTLYDLFRLVYQAEIMIPGIAVACGMSKYDAFWDQINLDRDPEDIDDVQYLELYWNIDYDTRITQKTGKTTDQQTSNCSILRDSKENYWDDPKIANLSNLMGFHGVGHGCPSRDIDFHECGDDCPTNTGYAIEFTPVNDLAHLPIRVSPKIEFFPPYVEYDRDFKRTGFEVTINPTLWCFITSVFFELTFVGSSPSIIANKAQDIYDGVNEIKENLDQRDIENQEDNQ